MDLRKSAFQLFARLFLLVLGGTAITAFYWSTLGGFGIIGAIFLVPFCSVCLFGTYMNFNLRNIHPEGKIVGYYRLISVLRDLAVPFVFYAAGKYCDKLGFFKLGEWLVQLKYWAMVAIPFLIGFTQGFVKRLMLQAYEKKLAKNVEERGLGPSMGSRLEFNAALGELVRGENLEEATQTVINFGCGIAGNKETIEVSATIPPQTSENTTERMVGETGHGQVAVETETRKETDELEVGRKFERVGKYKVSRTRNVIEFYYYFGSSETTSGIKDPAKAVDRYRVYFDPETLKLRCFGKVEYIDLFTFGPIVNRSKKVKRILGPYEEKGELALAMVVDLE